MTTRTRTRTRTPSPSARAARAALEMATVYPHPSRRPSTPGNIATLVGPTKHYPAFDFASYCLGRLGWLVFSVGSHRRSDADLETNTAELAVYKKTHKQKIDVSSLVFVVDLPHCAAGPKDIYVGRDTRAEINYAKAYGIRIEYLSGMLDRPLPRPAVPRDIHVAVDDVICLDGRNGRYPTTLDPEDGDQ